MQIETIKRVLLQDSDEADDTQKGAVLLRLYAIIMCIYLLAVLVTFSGVGQIFILKTAGPCFAMYCLSLYMTYKTTVRNASIVTFMTTVFLAVIMVYLLGWDCGVQHFLFALVVFCFLINAQFIKTNIAATVALCICRIILYFYSKMNIPWYVMNDTVSVVLQILNTVTIFALMIMMIAIFSQNAIETDKKLMLYNEKLQKLASLDPLTKLRNRRSILQYINECVDQYQQGTISHITLAMGDVDHFKKINDTYGHEIGDLVLKQVANAFDEFMQGKGCVGRWGGEEFLFVFPNYDGEATFAQMNDLQKIIKKLPSVSDAHAIKVTVTWGVEEYSDMDGISATLNVADRKLYKGKEAGRDRIIY